MTQSALEGGLKDPARDGAVVFRALMMAMARPGSIHQMEHGAAPAPMGRAAAALILTLCDPETGIYLAASHDCPEIRDWITFHTGAPIVAAGVADFALGLWDDLMPMAQFPIGHPEYPDRSTTLIVDGPFAGASAVLRGPGIKDTTEAQLPDIADLRANAGQFPLGLDFYFTEADRLMALPRSTKITPADEGEM